MENIVGSFYLKTFGERLYKFDVFDNGLMYCKDITEYPLRKIFLKPLFELYRLDENGNKEIISIPKRGCYDYIERVSINEELLVYMKKNNMIMYSTDVAYLYDLPNKDGYDIFYQKRAFKHVKDKSKILIKQKNGYYN